jgi:hypothetical protein
MYTGLEKNFFRIVAVIWAIGNMQKNDLVLGLGDRKLRLHTHTKLFYSQILI